jgi:hypothetical protein
MIALKAVILVLATVGIVYVSRFSLLDFRSHGFYRAFVWEAIVLLGPPTGGDRLAECFSGA